MVKEGFPGEVSRGLGARARGRGVGTRPGGAGRLKHMLPGKDTGLLMGLRLWSPRRERSLGEPGPARRERPERRRNRRRFGAWQGFFSAACSACARPGRCANLRLFKTATVATFLLHSKSYTIGFPPPP